MPKPTYNVYSIINGNDIDELNNFVNNYGVSGLDIPLKVGKCNLPLVEATQKDKKEIYDFILKNLPLSIIFNSTNTEKYLGEIIYSIKKTKTTYYYDELINKIKIEDPDNQNYYRKLACFIIDEYSYNIIEPVFLELLHNPLFNYQVAFNNTGFQVDFYKCIYNLSKPKMLSLLKTFKEHDLIQNNLVFKYIANKVGWKFMNETLNGGQEKDELTKFFKKNADFVDINLEFILTETKEGYYTSSTDFLKNYPFKIYLLYTGFTDLIKHYSKTEFLGKEAIELCKEENLNWCKKRSLFYPINCINYLVKYSNSEDLSIKNKMKLFKDNGSLPVNYLAYNKLFDQFRMFLIFLKEHSLEIVYTIEKPEFREYLIELFTKFKSVYEYNQSDIDYEINHINEIFN